jgi:methionyl aminopeptidase
VAVTEDAPLVLTRREPENPATRGDSASRLSTKDA